MKQTLSPECRAHTQSAYGKSIKFRLLYVKATPCQRLGGWSYTVCMFEGTRYQRTEEGSPLHEQTKLRNERARRNGKVFADNALIRYEECKALVSQAEGDADSDIDIEQQRGFMREAFEVYKKHIPLYYEEGSEDQKEDMLFFAAQTLKNKIVAEKFASLAKSPNVSPSEVIGMLKENFLAQVENAVADGFLSENTDLEKVKKRLEYTVVQLLDPVVQGHGTFGISRGEQGIVLIHPDAIAQGAEALRHIVFHELVHDAIAGLAVAVKITSNDEPTEVDFKKCGVRFNLRKTYPKRDATWLNNMNEGITEKIALHLSGHEDAHAYGMERAYVDHLTGKEIPFKLFVEAYQEEYRVNQPGIRVPRLQELLNKIREVKGDKWLKDVYKPEEASFLH